VRLKHFMTRSAVATVAASAVLLSNAAASQAVPEVPDITPATVEAAFEKATAANEEVNAVVEKQAKAQAAAKRLTRKIVKLKVKYDRQRELLGDSIVATHIENPLGPMTGLLASSDQESFIDNLRTVDIVNSARTDLMSSFVEARTAYEAQQSMLEAYQSDLATSRTQLEAKRADLQRAHELAMSQLAQLSASQQEAFNASATTVDFTLFATGNAKKALEFAIAQLGDPYSYGSTGPDSWDCSGLVQAAWAAGGVILPRTSGAQMGVGTPVAMSDLKPGDIVAFAPNGGGHVGLYIGAGKAIHAPRPGKSVEIVNVSMFSAATRVN
jgi:cell wall-associated NlpC family hydrolase